LVTPALGTPSSGIVTNLTGTASININGTVGATTPTTGAFTTATLSSNLTLNGGTANGVLFLNASKVATSGSALVFDGTSLGVNCTPSSFANFVYISINGSTGATLNLRSGNTSQFEINTTGTLNNFSSLTTLPFVWSINSFERARLSSDGTFRVAGAGTAGSSDAVQFSGSAPANSLVLNSSGNLGIGASSPLQLLHLSSASSPKIQITFQAVAAAQMGVAADNALTFGLDTSNGSTERARISSDGTFRVTGAGTAGSSDAVQFSGSAAANSLVLNSSGNLGIGTNSPSGRLTVVNGVGAPAAQFTCGSGTTQQEIAYFINSTNSGQLSIFGVGSSSVVPSWANGSIVSETVPSGSGNYIFGAYTGNIVFQTNNRTTRAQISSDGTFRVAGAGTAGSSDAVQFSGSAPANSLILNSSGRFLVSGTSGSLARFGTDSGNSTTNFFPVTVGDGDSANPGTNRNFVRIGRFSDGTAGIDAFAAGVGNAALSFGTFGTQRMLISSDGTFRVTGAGSAGTTDAVQFSGSAAANSLILNSSGNLGLGAAPGAWGTGGNFETPSASISVVLGVDQTAWATGARQTSYSGSWLSRGAYRATLYEQQTGLHVWYSSTTLPTAAGQVISFTQAMTLDLTGNLLLSGITSSIGSFWLQIKNTSSSANCVYLENASGNDRGILILKHDRATGGTTGAIAVFQNASGSTVGSIVASNTTTAYNTSSDYRLKENIQPMTNALAKVAALKPCTFNWKANGSAGQGFIAHELAEVVPDCVTGEKDAVNEDGSIKSQGVDTSFLIATLTAAIQELKAEFDAYKATHP
jgi:hypothetical protein